MEVTPDLPISPCVVFSPVRHRDVDVKTGRLNGKGMFPERSRDRSFTRVLQLYSFLESLSMSKYSGIQKITSS